MEIKKKVSLASSLLSFMIAIILVLMMFTGCEKEDSPVADGKINPIEQEQIAEHEQADVEIPQGIELEKATVVRVIDGDTLVVNYDGTEEKLRLIGVDTPESVHPKKELNSEEGIMVSDYTKKRIKENSTVYLEFDVSPVDMYGRLLAYVYFDEKGENMYNRELLEKGYAKTMTVQPNSKYADEFAEIQKNARENKKGLWNGMEDCWN